MQPTKTRTAMTRLITIIARLREPGGCPWDAEQTPESLKPYIIEEAYEVVEAIDLGRTAAIKEELGDLLLQIVLQARIFEERGQFDLEDVCQSIADKLERRHPHVFGTAPRGSIAEVHRQWEKIKQQEKAERGAPATSLGTLPPGLPALIKARKLTERASRAGFDWPDIDGAMAKVHEELAEFEEAFRRNELEPMEDELGDLLFAVANLARFINIDAENALAKTIRRFTDRFNFVEKALQNKQRQCNDASLEELLSLWDEAKRRRL